jgi:ketosteroid isomerase-like protein
VTLPPIASRLLAPLLALVVFASGCDTSEPVSAPERRAIADSLQSLVTRAYDFSQPDAAKRLLSLYPDTGRVISAFSGHVTNTRAALQTEIEGFWQRVGSNMQHPKFILGSVYVDVVTRNAAVMTFTYSIPHTTPSGMAHTVGGAWTTFWRRQGGRWMIVQEHLSDTPESTGPSGPPVDSGQSLAMPPGHQMPLIPEKVKKN